MAGPATGPAAGPVAGNLCPVEGCGKVFADQGALRKHSHVHGERQYICHYEACGKVPCLLTAPRFLLPAICVWLTLTGGWGLGAGE